MVKEMNLKYNYIEGVELGLTEEDIVYICHSGSNDSEVAEVTQKDYVQEQLKKYDEEALMRAVKAYITDNLEDIDTWQKKEEYVVWLVAWNIFEEQ